MRPILFLLTVLIFTACSRKSDGLTFIPKEAPLVIAIDPISLAYKANVGDWDELEFMQLLSEEVENESVRLSRRLENFMDNPSEMGIDLSKYIYVFQSGQNQGYVGVVLDLKDRDDFEEFVKSMFSEAEVDYEHKQVNEHRVFMLNNPGRIWRRGGYARSSGGALVYDKKRLVWIIPFGSTSRNNMVDIVRDITALGSRHQLVQQPAFNRFADEVSDISCFVNLGASKTMMGKQEWDEIEELYGEDVLDNVITCDLEFNRKTIELKANTQLNEKMTAFVERHDHFRKDMEDILLESLPGDALGALGMSLDLREVEHALQSDTILAGIRNYFIKQDGDFEKLDAMIKSLSAFTGDLLIDFYGFETVTKTERNYERTMTEDGDISYDWVSTEVEEEQPLMAVAIGLSGNGQLDSLFQAWNITVRDATADSALLAERSMAYQMPWDLLKFEDHYRFELLDGQGYMHVSDDRILLTNDTNLLNQAIAGELPENSMDDMDYADELIENLYFACMELDAQRYTDITDAQTNEDEKNVLALTDQVFSRLTMEQSEVTETTYTLETHSGDGNTLWRLIKLADQIYIESRER